MRCKVYVWRGVRGEKGCGGTSVLGFIMFLLRKAGGKLLFTMTSREYFPVMVGSNAEL